jgi:hypothetical protein
MGVERIKVTNDEDKDTKIGAEIPSQFTHSVKISETQKGVRIDIHVYATDRETAINEALQTYLLMQVSLRNTGIPLAPMGMEAGEKGQSQVQ